jgi:hypothetical protein
MNIPDHNNVYGEFKTTGGMRPVLTAVRKLTGVDQAFIYTSSFNGAEVLHFSAAEFDFESTPLGIHDHLLNGAVAGSTAEILEIVQAIAEAFTTACIEGKFEIYDDARNLVELVPDQTTGEQP